MKYFFRVSVVLLIALGIVFAYSYHYRKEKTANDIVLTTADMNSKEQTTKKERELICENKEGNYQLYVYGDDAVLVHDGIEKTFEKLASDVKQETPLMYYKDYDGDEESELLMKIVSGVTTVDGQNKSIYDLYLIKPAEINGKMDFQVAAASKNTWRVPFEEAISAEMSQLKKCDKFIQFVMDDNEVSLVYDEKTGLSYNSHIGFAQAIRKGNGKYEKFERWKKGNGYYDVDEKGNITLDIELFAYYENVKEPQAIGNIHTDIGIINGKFSIVPKTIKFVANKEYFILPATMEATDKWSCIINNSAAASSKASDTAVDWIEANFDLSYDYTERTVSFAGMSSQIKCVDNVKITPGAIVLTAKEGYTFSQSVLDKDDYSVVIQPGTGEEYNIAYSGEIKTVEGRSVLKIKFDMNYPKYKLSTIVFKFGE